MNQSSQVIEAENLRVIRGRVEVLDIPSFVLAEREILSLIGPNGSGKSSLLLTLNCLLKPCTGRILFRGREIGSNQEVLDYRRRIAMVFQEPLIVRYHGFQQCCFRSEVQRDAAGGNQDQGYGRTGTVQHCPSGRPLGPQIIRRRSPTHLPGPGPGHRSGSSIPR